MEPKYYLVIPSVVRFYKLLLLLLFLDLFQSYLTCCQVV